MTTAFDGSTGDGSAAGPIATAAQVAPESDDMTGLSALEQLRAVVDERAAERDDWVKIIAGGQIRITCMTSVDNFEYQRWMRAALPKRNGRRSGAPDMTQMNQLTLTTRAILHCTTQVEVRNPKVMKANDPNAWMIVTDPQTGAPLALNDAAMLATFRTPDAGALVTKMIGRDSDVINVGLELLEACGYIPGDEDEDESDPT